MKKVRITVKRAACYRDLMEEYENPIEHACEMKVGQVFTANGWQRPESFCESAWETVSPFVMALAHGAENLYDGWMKNSRSAMISCNDGFRPVSFLLEATDEDAEPEGGARKEPELRYVTLREVPELMQTAVEWFHGKWGVPKEAYLACMEPYLKGETEYGWYLCLAGERIVGGLGVIENDFHDRKDLAPNVCAVYTEEEWRCRGIAGRLLSKVVDDMREKGISPLYLVTDHTGFYERYGWEFLCMVQGDGEPDLTRMYIHR